MHQNAQGNENALKCYDFPIGMDFLRRYVVHSVKEKTRDLKKLTKSARQ